MRLAVLSVAGLASVVSAQPAAAATVIVFTHPETLERKLVVVDRDGPDRLFMCMLPPGEAGCQQMPLRRKI